MTLSIEDAKERARRGAALLTECYPEWDSVTEWRRKIDLAKLELSDPYRCVLGQTYDDYDRGCEILFGIVCVTVLDPDFCKIVEHGFSVMDPFDFSIQQRAWIAILTD